MNPSIGRIVNVGTPIGFKRELYDAAIVTRANGNLVNVQMFLDHHGGYVYMSNLSHEDQAGPNDLCWRWPEIIK